jgi:hypothetical protein
LLPDTITLNGRVMKIYKSRVMMPHENVLLADNGYENTTFDTSSNMYLLFVVNIETQVVEPTDVVSASSTQVNNPVTTAAQGIDGITTTRWVASDGTYPQTYNLTLDKPYAIGGYDINWYSNASRYYQYKIEVSTDNNTWNTALDNTGNTLEGDFQFRVPSTGTSIGQYVRITITNGSSGYASFYELKINGIDASMLTTGAPTFTSAGTAVDTQGLSFNYQVTVANGATSYSASGLPAGLTIDPSSGLISGTTTQTGTFSVTITATNNSGSTSTTLSLIVGAGPTDTPTMPQWALIMLAGLLFGFAYVNLGKRGIGAGTG